MWFEVPTHVPCLPRSIAGTKCEGIVTVTGTVYTTGSSLCTAKRNPPGGLF